jgi:hypothetical protein
MPGDNPTLALPEAEAAHLQRAYAAARIILEYGSGASTRLAAGMPGKYVMSVESDRAWATRLQLEIDEAGLPSPAIVYPVDIGPTGAWGRPVDASAWTLFHRYPLAIWDEHFFRHPDFVLIDGRFRPACLITTLMRIERPVRVLFDDYAERPHYHVVEKLVRPERLIGRMAEFRLEPGIPERDAMTLIVSTFAQASYARGRPATLGAKAPPLVQKAFRQPAL